MGRFTSVDPVEENHPYSYVANNPLKFVDPDGEKLKMLLKFGDKDFNTNVQLANNRISELNSYFEADLLTMDNDGYLSIQGLDSYEGSEDQKAVLGVFEKVIDSYKTFEVVNQQESKYTMNGCFVECSRRIILEPESKATFKAELGENFEMVEFSPMITFVHEATHAAGGKEKEAVEMGNRVRTGIKRHFYTAMSGEMLDFVEGYKDPEIDKNQAYYLTPEEFDNLPGDYGPGYNIMQNYVREVGTVGPTPSWER